MLRLQAADRFVRDIDPALGEQIFDVPQAQSEAIKEPDAEPDHLWREAMALEGNGIHAGISQPAKNRQAETGCG